MDLQAIVDRIEIEGLGVPGVNLFRMFMPASVEEGLVVLPSQLPVEIDMYTTVKRQGQFRVVARGIDWDGPRNLLMEVSKVLHGEGLQFGEEYYFYMIPQHEPLLYPLSDGDLVEGSVSFNCCYVV